MTSEASRLALARILLDDGAGQSARNVLGAVRGAAANRIRVAASEVTLRPGVFALVTLADARGAALPLRPVAGHPRSKDPAFREACVVAFEHARAVLEERSLPMLRFELEEELSLVGPSIGLPAALAFVAYFARAPARPVLATGELLPDGRVLQVGQLDAKYSLARSEHGEPQLVFPAGGEARLGVDHVASFAEAARAVYGEGPLRLDPSHGTVDVVLRRARSLAAAEESIALLSALDRDALLPADRARVLFDLGSFHRNLGHASASAFHAEARELLASERDVIGADAAERYELECWATELDRYRLDAATAELRARLSRPFLKLRNELRCRGMLAQGLAMAGHLTEAVELRSANLALHERSAALDRVRPATLCHLARDAAFAGNARLFEESVTALAHVTTPGDEPQWRYNASAIARGLVVLGRLEEAIAWSRGEVAVLGCQAPTTLRLALTEEARSITAPELTTLRALLRALRKRGLAEEAIVVGRRALERAGEPTDLFGWMAALLRLELGLAEGSERTTSDAQERLRRHHPEATEFHASLLSSDPDGRERELDRVWY